mgnify:CR=1 FL=1
MKLDDISRYFSPAAPSLENVALPSSPDRLSRADILAALGLIGKECRFGLLLHLVRTGVCRPEDALKPLYHTARDRVSDCPPLLKLDAGVRRTVLSVLCGCAIEDYARSAASKPPCTTCNGSGFTDAEVFSNQISRRPAGSAPHRGSTHSGVSETWREIRETVRVCCSKCGGKGVLRSACRCLGRGEVLDRRATALHGAAVMKACGQCRGRGYSRMAFSLVLRRLSPAWSPGKTLAYRDIRPFFNMLVSHCHQEESRADRVLRNTPL